MPLERSLLIVPGSDTEAVDAARETVADVVIIDLEDTVAPSDKEFARETALEALRDWPDPGKLGVRINGIDTDRGITDAEALLSNRCHPDFFAVPDVRGPDETRIVADIADDHGSAVTILPLIEKIDAVFTVREIARSTPRIHGLLFAAIDFQMNMGMSVLGESDVYLPRYLVSMAASAAGVAAFDKPLLSIDDDDRLRRDAEEARGLGYDGKLAVNEDHAAVINRAFTPSHEELEEAKRVIEAFEASEAGFVDIGGTVVDKPVIGQLRDVLARAETAGIDTPDV